MKTPPNKLVNSAPEGTVWFGGPVDRSEATLRILGDNLDPEEISELLGTLATRGEKKGDVIVVAASKQKRIARTGRWSLESKLPVETDIDDKILELLEHVTDDESIWSSINKKYKVDIFCGIFMEADNRGFSLSVKTLKKLAALGIVVGFDIYGPESK